MRVFMHGEEKHFEQLDANMLRLMKLLRLDVAHLEHVNLFKKTRPERLEEFGNVVEGSQQYGVSAHAHVEHAFRLTIPQKISHYLQLNEEMRKNSSNANIIFVLVPA